MSFKDKINNRIKRIIGEDRHIVLNINCNLLDKKQKRILLCYLTSSLEQDLSRNIFHPNIPRCNQMITSLIRMGYAVDVCDCRNMKSFSLLKNREYDTILGFGPIFELMSSQARIPHRIIYVTENDPNAIENKYNERLAYFRARHKELKICPKNMRDTFYNQRQFELASAAIIMTNDYNAVNIKRMLPLNFKIKVNGFVNPKYSYSSSDISVRRKNFLWFGSVGLYQKGLDILIDVFSELPEYTLNVFGANRKELSSIKKLIPSNVKIHSKVSVQSDDFLNVINENLFIISASCLEGMQSGVATCMRHGLIPMLTHECGYDEHPSIIFFDNYRVETIINKIREVLLKSDSELSEMSKQVFNYGNSEFTLEHFVETFEKGFQKLVSKE